MADNIIVKDAGGTPRIIATNEVGNVHTPKHILVTEKTILRAAIDASTSGNNTLVAATASVKTKVLSVTLTAAAAVTVTFQNGAGGASLTGAISLIAGVPYILDMVTNPDMHWMETSANTLLNLSLGGGVQVSGLIVYYQQA